MSRFHGLCLGLFVSLWTAQAQAGGLYLTERGAASLGRGGALVAGASGLEGIGLNPAAISDAGLSLFADFGLAITRVRYQRELAIADPDGTVHRVQSPMVEGKAQPIPFPTLALSYPIARDWTLAAGLYSPYFALVEYAPTVQGQPSPARYMLGSLANSRLGLPGAWLGWRAHPMLDLGIGVQALVGTFRSSITFTLSLPDRLIAAPEQPDYDALAALDVGPIFAPTASAGLRFKPLPGLRIGLSGQLPTWLDADATIGVRLPDSATFDSVAVQGDRARVQMRLPAILRAGVQWSPLPDCQLELAYVREFWSAHDRIRARPDGIQIDGIIGGPPSVKLPVLDVERGFVDSQSFRLGGALALGPVTLRAGVSHERSAVPAAYLSLASIDFNKTGLHLGAGLRVSEHFHIDAGFMHVLSQTVRVDPAQAALVRVNPLSGNAPLDAINGGDYRLGATVIAVASRITFDPPRRLSTRGAGGAGGAGGNDG